MGGWLACPALDGVGSQPEGGSVGVSRLAPPSIGVGDNQGRGQPGGELLLMCNNFHSYLALMFIMGEHNVRT